MEGARSTAQAAKTSALNDLLCGCCGCSLNVVVLDCPQFATSMLLASYSTFASRMLASRIQAPVAHYALALSDT